MIVQLFWAMALFAVPIMVYLIVQRKWSRLRNRLVSIVFVGLIFTLTLYIPIHEGGHILFATLSGIQITEKVLFFVTETGLRNPAVVVNATNINNPVFRSRYVISWAGGILTTWLLFSIVSILIYYFKKHGVLYFSILPILRSFFETNDLWDLSVLTKELIILYSTLGGFFLLFVYFLKLSLRLRGEAKASKRLSLSLGLTSIFSLFFSYNPIYGIAALISSLGAYLNQIDARTLSEPISVFLAVFTPFVLKWGYDAFQNRKNRNRLLESLRKELETCKKRLQTVGNLLPNSLWLSTINSGYIILLPFDLRIKMSNIYSRIQWYNYEAERVRDIAVLDETAPNPDPKISYYWSGLTTKLRSERDRIMKELEELLKQKW